MSVCVMTLHTVYTGRVAVSSRWRARIFSTAADRLELERTFMKTSNRTEQQSFYKNKAKSCFFKARLQVKANTTIEKEPIPHPQNKYSDYTVKPQETKNTT